MPTDLGLVNLLPAFYELTTGQIKIDGHDIGGITLDSLRAHIGVVSQDPSDRHFALARYSPSGALDPGFGVSGLVVTTFPPNTTITKMKVDASLHTASFKFGRIGSATAFQCALRSRQHQSPRFRRCGRPKSGPHVPPSRRKKTYKHLRPGRYAFEVRAIALLRQIRADLFAEIIEQQRVFTQLLRKQPLSKTWNEHDFESDGVGAIPAAMLTDEYTFGKAIAHGWR